MHDEAATHYVGMIDQTTLGPSITNPNFGPLLSKKMAQNLDF